MWTRQIPLGLLAEWCRGLGQSLHAGLSIKQALKRRSEQAGPVAELSAKMLAVIKEGGDLSDAAQAVRDRVPALLVAMVGVAQQSGRLPEILKELSRYFSFQLSLRRKFLSQITWPILQFVAAIFVVAGLIYLMGALAQPGSKGMDVLGLGLIGTSGAIIWLGGWVFLVVALIVTYYSVRNVASQAAFLDGLLLKIPVLGPTLKILALSRFCFAGSVTFDSNLSTDEALRLALDATDNDAFRAVHSPAVIAIEAGDDLAEALAPHAAFQGEFIELVATGVETGSLPETLERLAKSYNERAEHQMTLLNQAAGWLIWMMVAGLIIFLIFRIVMVTYIAPLNDAVNMLNSGRV